MGITDEAPFLENSKSAYPWSVNDGKRIVGTIGITKREKFAESAMVGFLSNPEWLKKIELAIKYSERTGEDMCEVLSTDPNKFGKYIAKLAVQQADALIAELEKE
jgi:hypothetical protein